MCRSIVGWGGVWASGLSVYSRGAGLLAVTVDSHGNAAMNVPDMGTMSVAIDYVTKLRVCTKHVYAHVYIYIHTYTYTVCVYIYI